MNGMFRRSTILASMILLASAPCALPQVPAQAVSKSLPGGGQADPAGKIGYFPNTVGGVDALALADGKLLWSTKECNLPLAATEKIVYAQKGNGNQLRIVALDAGQEGKVAWTSPPLPLPGWASVGPAYGRSFHSAIRMEGGTMFVIWEARAFYAGGARPTAEVEKRARMEASGVARVDLSSGKVDPLDADAIAAGKFFPIPFATVEAGVGALRLQVQDGPAVNGKNPFERRRTLQALSAAKEIVWQRDIAAPVFLPPLP